MHTTTAAPRLLKLPEVCARTAQSRSQIYTLIREGTFPSGVKLTAVSVAWRESDVTAWIDGLAAVGEFEKSPPGLAAAARALLAAQRDLLNSLDVAHEELTATRGGAA